MVSVEIKMMLSDFIYFFNRFALIMIILAELVILIALQHRIQLCSNQAFLLYEYCRALEHKIIEQEKKFWHARSHQHILACAIEQGLVLVIDQG